MGRRTEKEMLAWFLKKKRGKKSRDVTVNSNHYVSLNNTERNPFISQEP